MLDVYYHVMLGDFDKFNSLNANEDLVGKILIMVFFILTTFVLMIVMLNLLIAFICDSY